MALSAILEEVHENPFTARSVFAPTCLCTNRTSIDEWRVVRSGKRRGKRERENL